MHTPNNEIKTKRSTFSHALGIEVMKQLLRLHWQRCETQQIYKETPLLLGSNKFLFLTRFF